VTLNARVAVRLGRLDLDVDLRVDDGEVVAVLGPNGAGKTTLLRVLAGLHPLDAGRIELAGEVVDDPAAGVFVPTERRRVGMVFQDYLLFPHLTARDNVAFGLRAGGMAARTARAAAEEWLGRMGMAGAAGARPGALSGGQQQRVALARALAPGPRLLLLDEPLAALDVGARVDVRRELAHHLRSFGGARLLVTHDPVDAHALADRVVVLEDGRVTHDAPLRELAARPRSGYVADLVGTNLLTGTARDGVLVLEGGGEVVLADPVDGPVHAVIPPHAVAVYPGAPEGSPRNVWPATVTSVDVHHGRARVRLDGPVPVVAEVVADAVTALGLVPGRHVHAVVKATEITTYPA
jgi:molybdate transport system ATP-binding protein